MPAHDNLSSTNSNGEQSAIINKIPGVHLDDNEEDVAKNSSDEVAGHSTEDDLNK